MPAHAHSLIPCQLLPAGPSVALALAQQTARRYDTQQQVARRKLRSHSREVPCTETHTALQPASATAALRQPAHEGSLKTVLTSSNVKLPGSCAWTLWRMVSMRSSPARAHETAEVGDGCEESWLGVREAAGVLGWAYERRAYLGSRSET
jgi:hypothetical protein